MTNLTSSNIIPEILGALPELQQAFTEYAKYDDISLVHNVFVFVFNPFLKNMSNIQDQKILKRIFSFLEAMAKSFDPEITNILAVTILESLSPAQLTIALKYMGPKTKTIYQELEKYLENLFERVNLK